MSLPDTAGLRLVSGAWSFWRAAQLLHEDDPKGLSWAPCFINLGLAIELSLKGFLRENGITVKEQIAFGHDLVRLFDAAVTRGFKPSHQAHEALVKEISPHYQDMTLRYLEGTSVSLPPLKDAIAVTQLLTHDVYVQTTAPYR